MTAMWLQSVLASIPANRTSEGLATFPSSRDTDNPPEQTQQPIRKKQYKYKRTRVLAPLILNPPVALKS